MSTEDTLAWVSWIVFVLLLIGLIIEFGLLIKAARWAGPPPTKPAASRTEAIREVGRLKYALTYAISHSLSTAAVTCLTDSLGEEVNRLAVMENAPPPLAGMSPVEWLTDWADHFARQLPAGTGPVTGENYQVWAEQVVRPICTPNPNEGTK